MSVGKNEPNFECQPTTRKNLPKFQGLVPISKNIMFTYESPVGTVLQNFSKNITYKGLQNIFANAN